MVRCPHCRQGIQPRDQCMTVLSPKLYKMVSLFVQGASRTEIASQMGKTLHNVTVQLGIAKEKLGILTDVELVLLAYGFTKEQFSCPGQENR